MRACGYEPPYPEDVTFPVPREIFPTGKKTARYGLVVRRAGEGNRPLEPIAMDTARARLVAELQHRDHAKRFRMYHPVTTDGTGIYCHAKVMVVDDDVIRIGSSNFNNRSLRLDTECDVTIADDGDRIAAIRAGASNPRIRSAARSPMTIAGALVCPRMTVGMTEASATRRPRRSSPSASRSRNRTERGVGGRIASGSRPAAISASVPRLMAL